MLSKAPLVRALLAGATPALFAALVLFASPRANAAGADGTWSVLSDPATAPTRVEHAAIYDPVRDRLVIFGGENGVPTNGLSALSFSPLPTWTRLFPTGGGPTTFFGQQGIYDPVRDRMIVLDASDIRTATG